MRKDGLQQKVINQGACPLLSCLAWDVDQVSEAQLFYLRVLG